MSLRDDIHGSVFSDNNVKLYYPTHSWNMKALFSNDDNICILTDGFGNMEKFIDQINSKEFGTIRVLCNSSNIEMAREFHVCAPKVEIRHKPNISAKIFLRSDGRIFISSEDIGKSDDLSVSIGLKSKTAYSEYMEAVFEKAWAESKCI